MISIYSENSGQYTIISATRQTHALPMTLQFKNFIEKFSVPDWCFPFTHLVASCDEHSYMRRWRTVLASIKKPLHQNPISGYLVRCFQMDRLENYLTRPGTYIISFLMPLFKSFIFVLVSLFLCVFIVLLWCSFWVHLGLQNY